MLTPAQLADFSMSIEANANRLIAAHQKSRPTTACLHRAKNPNERRGRPVKKIINRFAGQIGPATDYDRYPDFAMDVVQGISRLDWHNRKENSTECSKPLSVKLLMNILAFIDHVSTSSVAEYLGLGVRHAQRYVKAIELIMPHLLASRPERLIDAMDPDGSSKQCPLYLRRMHIREAYRVLAGDIPMDRAVYYSLGQHQADAQGVGDQWNAFPADQVN